MIAFALKRIGAAIVIVIFLTLAMFFLQHLSHTDPAHALLGAGASQSAVHAESHRLGLDKPLLVQYAHYLVNLLHGDLGVSYRTRQPIVSDLSHYLPATIELSAFSLVLASLLGLVLGIGGAGKWRGAGIFRFVLICGASMPPFLLALLGILFLYGHFGILPATGRTSIVNAPTGPTGLLTIDGLLHGRPNVTFDALRHLILPAICIALTPAVSIGRILRSSLEENLRSDFVRTAQAKGLRPSAILLRHALRNSIGPALSMAGLQVGLMFAGVVVIEQIFAWPGIGFYTAQSIPQSDFPAIAGVTLILSIAYVLINAIVDVLQAVADPRIRP